MRQDIHFTVILAAWLLSLVSAFVLGLYATYRLEGETISTQQYREQSLQYLEDIRDSNDHIYNVLVQ